MRAAIPRVPVGLAHRPTIGGLIVPWVNLALADGGADFRGIHNTKWQRAWTEGLCQVCGLPLVRPVVLLGGPNQLAGYFDEAPLHPWCAAYTAKACPMVAGRLARYADRPQVSEGRRGQVCPEPGCNCGGWTHTPGIPHGSGRGEPAHAWWAVWCENYALAATPQGRLLGGVPAGELRRRLVSTPPTEPVP